MQSPPWKKRPFVYFQIISLLLSYESSVFIANLNSLFSSNIFGPIKLQVYFPLHHMLFFLFSFSSYHLGFVTKNLKENGWK